MIRLTLRRMRRRPGRAFLTLQGVIWSVALGVFPPAVIFGSRDTVLRRAAELDTDRILIACESAASAPLTWELVDDLRGFAGARAVAGIGIVPASAIGARTPLLVVDASALAARNQVVAAGRFIEPADRDGGAAVAVLEARLADQLGHEGAVGSAFELGDGQKATVVGVLAPRPSSLHSLDDLGYQQDHRLSGLARQLELYGGVIADPFAKTLKGDGACLVSRALFPDLAPRWVEVRCDPREVVALRDRLQTWLVGRGVQPNLYINAVLPALFGQTLRSVEELHYAIFALGLMVGTTVICCVTVLGVLERRHEIAIRRTEGARAWQIGLMFLVETAVQCGIGGLLGIPLAFGLAAVRTALDPHGSIDWTVPYPQVAIVWVASVAGGMLTGLIPAVHAARVDPVEVLRYD